MRYRAWHRGTREMDFIFGAFVDQHLSAMDNAAMTLFEALMDIDDQTLYRWISGTLPVPKEFDTEIMAQLKALRFTEDDFGQATR